VPIRRKEGGSMSKKLFIESWGFCMSILIFGCATGMTPLRDYKPKSQAETEIKKTLLNLEEVRNQGDIQRALTFIHDQAQFQDGCRSLATVSKAEIPDVLERSIEYRCTRKYLSPTISVRGVQADVKISVVYDCKSSPWDTFVQQAIVSMVKEGDKWLLLKYNVACP
jgi:hypothetical protein